MHPRFATALNSTWFQSQLARQTFLVAIDAVIGGRLEKRRLLRPGHRIVNCGAGCSAGLKCMWPRQPSCDSPRRLLQYGCGWRTEQLPWCLGAVCQKRRAQWQLLTSWRRAMKRTCAVLKRKGRFFHVIFFFLCPSSVCFASNRGRTSRALLESATGYLVRKQRGA